MIRQIRRTYLDEKKDKQTKQPMSHSLHHYCKKILTKRKIAATSFFSRLNSPTIYLVYVCVLTWNQYLQSQDKNRRRMFSMNETDLRMAWRGCFGKRDPELARKGCARGTPLPGSALVPSFASAANTKIVRASSTHTLSLSLTRTHTLRSEEKVYRNKRRIVGHQVYTTIREWVTWRHDT